MNQTKLEEVLESRLTPLGYIFQGPIGIDELSFGKSVSDATNIIHYLSESGDRIAKSVLSLLDPNTRRLALRGRLASNGEVRVKYILSLENFDGKALKELERGLSEEAYDEDIKITIPFPSGTPEEKELRRRLELCGLENRLVEVNSFGRKICEVRHYDFAEGEEREILDMSYDPNKILDIIVKTIKDYNSAENKSIFFYKKKK